MPRISVRELAEDLKSSKQAVHNHIKQLLSNLMPKKVEEIRSMVGYSSTDNQVDNQLIDKVSTELETLTLRIDDLKFNNNKPYTQMDKKIFK